MPFEVTVRIDPSSMRAFGAFKGNVRVAAAIGLTKVAKDAQAALKDEAGSLFHLRNKWVPQGIRIEPASAASLIARVGSIDKYMARHVVGERKQAQSSLRVSSTRDENGRYATGGLLIGLYGSIGDAKTHTQERRMLSRIDGQKNKTFQILARDGSVLIVRRAARKKTGLDILAVMKNSAKEEPMWDMLATVAAVAQARFLTHFEAAVTFKGKPKS